MCLAIPAEVIKIDEDMADVRVGGAIRRASLMLLPPGDVQVGDFVILHAGFALHRLNPNDARESLRLLREMAQGGETV